MNRSIRTPSFKLSSPLPRGEDGGEGIVGPYPLPQGWRWVRLEKACELNPRRPEIKLSPTDLVTFIQMSAVAQSGRGVIHPERKPFREVHKGYTYFGEGDILFAKITPCMQNGKHAIVRNLPEGFGFGSTEFHVLRPNRDVLPEWIHSFLVQPWVLEGAKAHFSGAVGQQRVPESYLAGLMLPLPSLADQKRIATMLTDQMTAVERARAAAEAQLETATALQPSYLQEAFQNREVQDWPKKRFDEIAILQRGYDLPAHIRRPGSYPVVTSSGVVGTHDQFRSKGPGVVTGRSGSIGKVHYVQGDYWPHNTALFVKDFLGNHSRFVFYLLQWIGTKSVSSGTGVPTLDRKQVHKLVVPCPNVGDQARIAARLDAQYESSEKTCITVASQLETLNQLPAALLRRAFSGEL